MQSAKAHITKIVDDYKRLFPDDYQTVVKGIQLQRDMLLDQKFGTALGTGSDMRALFEIPADLSEMFIMRLSEGEMEWFKAGGTNRKAGGRWFAKTFREFALPENI